MQIIRYADSGNFSLTWLFFRIKPIENVFNCERKSTKLRNVYRTLKMSSDIK